MTVVPAVSVRGLGDMKPGELVRVRGGYATLLGIVAGCDSSTIPSGKLLLMLEAYPEGSRTGGRFIPIDDRMISETALSYGTELNVVVDPLADVSPNVEIDGALLVGSGASAIRARGSNPPYDSTVLAIETGSWQATSPYLRASPWRFAVLAWELRLVISPAPNPHLPPLFRFRAED